MTDITKIRASAHNSGQDYPGNSEVTFDDDLDDLLAEVDASEDDATKAAAVLTQKFVTGLTLAKDAAATGFLVTEVGAIAAVDDPLQRLEELMEEVRQHGKYSLIRKQYCELMILINLQGRHAPAFRPELVTGRPFEDPSYHAIHRDQIVIDCHWLYVRDARIQPRSPKYRLMFSHSKPFSFDLAWQFACEKWKGLHRSVSILELTMFQQCQMLAIRSPGMKERFKAIYKGTRKDGVYIPSKYAFFQIGLKGWCERDKRMLRHIRGYEAVWLSRELLGSNASIGQIAELSALITGEAPKDVKTIKSKEEKIRRHIFGV